LSAQPPEIPPPDEASEAAASPSIAEPAFSGRFRALKGRSLRAHAARGTIVNAFFDIGLSSLNLIRGFVVAGFLTANDYGLWGILVVALGTLLWLKQAGIGDKFIQQDEADQELAFQKAFTLEAAFTGIFMLIMLAAIPLIAFVYGQEKLVLPALAMVAILPAGVLQTPLWIAYREMRFVRQRVLQGIEPVVGFFVAIGLAAAGAGYWALILGVLVGVYASGIAAIAVSPYPLRFRYEPGTLREYASFSWPLLAAGGSGLVIAQTSILFGEKHLGLAAAGAMTLAATISQYANRVDAVVTGTLYPAICAIRDRTELLFESFVKSNRLGLMWAVPFGVGLALFASDLIHFGIGDKWHEALPLLQVYGLIAAAYHLGYNWDAYFRARGETRPIGIAAAISMVVFLVAAIPLLYIWGLKGFAAGVAIQGAAHIACRWYFLRRLFRGLSMAPHAIRAISPTVPAAGAILLTRAVESGHRTLGLALGEVALYVLVTIVATLFLERRLLQEVTKYLREGRARPAVA
jgi:O-antigen/teichoic acid export membrane protein